MYLHVSKTFVRTAQSSLPQRRKHLPFHTHPDPEPPAFPTALPPSLPPIPILWAAILTPAPSFWGSFWFPFWFLTIGAICGWPAVPLILLSHCVLSWAGPWAPGAGRGARNGLIPVAVLVKGTVAPFPLVLSNCCETDFGAFFVFYFFSGKTSVASSVFGKQRFWWGELSRRIGCFWVFKN